MRIILLEHPRIQSEFHYNDIANTPLWSCLMTGYAAASLLDAGFDAEIVDATLLSFEETIETVVERHFDLLCIHATYFWENTDELFTMLRRIKRIRPESAICLYGFFPTLAWNDILQSVPEVDWVIVGEPELTMVDLAKSLENGAVEPLEGLASRTKTSPFLRPRNPIAPVEALPFPIRPFLESQTTVDILASRGCYNGCSFCLVPALNGRAQWRGRAVESVVAEIAGLVKLGKRDFYFADPNFIGPGEAGKRRTVALARALSGLGISFGMETRAGDLTEELTSELRRAGLTSLLLGIESGSPGVLNRLGKNAAISHNERAIALVRDQGIEPEIGFIMFEPASAIDDVSESFRFLKRNELLGILGRTANLLYHEQIVFRGTPGYARALSQGLLTPTGIFGFEGRPIYKDRRVGWLAGMMRPICQFLLREMDRESSGIHWSLETSERREFRSVNDCLVAVFTKLMSTAAAFDALPEPYWSAQLLSETIEGIKQAIPADRERATKDPSSPQLLEGTK